MGSLFAGIAGAAAEVSGDRLAAIVRIVMDGAVEGAPVRVAGLPTSAFADLRTAGEVRAGGEADFAPGQRVVLTVWPQGPVALVAVPSARPGRWLMDVVDDAAALRRVETVLRSADAGSEPSAVPDPPVVPTAARAVLFQALAATADPGREAIAAFQAVQEELGRVAHRLHGQLLQELSAMAMTVDLVREDAGDGGQLARLDDILGLVIATARGFVRDARPGLDTAEDVVFALRDLVARRAPAGTPFLVTSAPPGRQSSVARMLAFRVLEAVLQVGGDAGVAFTRVAFDGRRPALEVEGRGRVDPDAVSALALLRRVSEATGGSLTVAHPQDPGRLGVRWSGPGTAGEGDADA